MPEITQFREKMKDKKRIVIKIGSSSLQHAQTGDLDYTKLDVLVRELCDIRNRGKDVVLVTSGAVAVGRKAVMRQGIEQDDPTAVKQACAAIGQARLMMTYQKIFAEYNQVAAQILMTKNTIIDNLNRFNARNTFAELFKLGVVPIVDADMLILLSDIDGLYTDDPRKNPAAKYIEVVEELTEELMEMGKASTGSSSGTGGMNTKLQAARIAGNMGVDMVIANSADIKVIHRILAGQNIGTLFLAHKEDGFDLPLYVQQMAHD